MKKIISAVALFLVFSIVAVMCCSCANIFISQEALAAISERILEGVNKISSATALDAKFDMTGSLSSKAFSFISIELPAYATARFNLTDKNNPTAYFDMGLRIDASQLPSVLQQAEFFDGQNMNMSFYYSDGYTYTASSFLGESSNRKMKTELGEFSTLPVLNYTDVQNLVFFDESMIKSASLRNHSDGSLTARVKVDGNKASYAAFKLLGKIFNIDNADDAASISEMLDLENTDVSITVDKDNNVTNFKLDIKASMDIGGGQKITMGLDMNVDFAVVGEDYVVPAPENLDSYKEIDLSDYGKTDHKPSEGEGYLPGIGQFIPDLKSTLYTGDGFQVMLLNDDSLILVIEDDDDNSSGKFTSKMYHMHTLYNETVDTLFDSDMLPKARLFELVDKYR